MRRVLFATVALCGLPGVARAQIPVTDTASILARQIEHLQTLAKWVEQTTHNARQELHNNRELAQLLQTYNETVRIYNQSVTAYQAVTGVRDLGSAMYALNMAGIQNPLPISPAAVQSLLRGEGGLSGIAGNIGSLYTGSLNANRVYIPQGSDFRAREMAAAANSNAGAEALAQHLYQARSDGLAKLAALRARQATASDPKEVQDLQAAVAVVQADLESQGQQFGAIQAMRQTQAAVQVQRSEEYERQCIDRLIAYYSRQSDSASCPPPQPSQAGVTRIVAGGSGGGIATAAGSSSALDTMMSRGWGAQAAANASALGVNPSALAATCVVESGCQNVNGTGTVSGAFQMTNSTYAAAMRAAGQNYGMDGKMDPAIQSIAASQELKSAALSLQRQGIANPTVLDTRAIYQWGAGAGPALAAADNSQTMSSVLPAYGAAALRANGIEPGVTTVGQWRQDIINKVGDAAYQPVLAGQRST